MYVCQIRALGLIREYLEMKLKDESQRGQVELDALKTRVATLEHQLHAAVSALAER